MANQYGREPRWQRRLSFLTAGIDIPCGKLPNFRAQCRLGRVSSDAFSVAFFHSDGAETRGGREVWQQRYFETVGAIVALPNSTPSGGRRLGSQMFSINGEHTCRSLLIRQPEFRLFPLLGMSCLEDEMTSPGPVCSKVDTLHCSGRKLM